MAHLLSVPLTAIWPICSAKGKKKKLEEKKKKKKGLGEKKKKKEDKARHNEDEEGGDDAVSRICSLARLPDRSVIESSRTGDN